MLRIDQYKKNNISKSNELKMFDFDRIIVRFNIAIVERVDSPMIVCSMKTSGEVNI